MDYPAMDVEELRTHIDVILGDALTIAHNQMILAQVHAELEKNQLNPFEQDFIYREQFGQLPSEPKRIEINGVTIFSRILHQTGASLSDVRGADLLYEINSEKFGLIQYKREAGARVRNDPRQLDRLLSNCPELCPNRRKRPMPAEWVPSKIFSFCGIWYAVGDGSEWRYLTACEVEGLFQNGATREIDAFQTGLSRLTFMELFTSCRIGALLSQPLVNEARTAYISDLLAQKHLVLEVRQQGRWQRSRRLDTDL